MTPEDTELVLSELDPIQKDIEARESESIEARWDFGRVLLTHRAGKKQLPPGLRSEIAKKYKLEASEITRRMQLAEKFTTREEVVDACARCGRSWRRMIREELTKSPRQPKETPWAERIRARLGRLVQEAGKSDERHDALVGELRLALSTLSDADETVGS
jgi:hypothetical protein